MRRRRYVPTPGVGAARDGLVGLGCGTGQQWLDFCVMVEHPEWMEDQRLFLDRTALAPTIDAWIAEHTVEEVLDLASAFRIPNAPIANGSNVTTIEHFRARESFVANPRDGSVNPRPPFRLGAGRLRTPEPAPRLGEHSIDAVLRRERTGTRTRRGDTRTSVPGAARAGHDVLLGGSVHGPRARAPRSGGDPPRIPVPARRRASGRRSAADRGSVLGARADLRRAQHQQEEHDDRHRRSTRHRSRAPVHRDVRRGRRELHAARAGPARSRLRDAQGRPTRSPHAPDAGVRARWAVA